MIFYMTNINIHACISINIFKSQQLACTVSRTVVLTFDTRGTVSTPLRNGTFLKKGTLPPSILPFIFDQTYKRGPRQHNSIKRLNNSITRQQECGFLQYSTRNSFDTLALTSNVSKQRRLKWNIENFGRQRWKRTKMKDDGWNKRREERTS